MQKLFPWNLFKKIFDEKDWPEDMSFRRGELTNLIEALSIRSVDDDELALDIADVVTCIHVPLVATRWLQDQQTTSFS